MFWSVGWPLLWAGGFCCNLDILYGGLGIGKLQFLIKKKFNFFFSCFFSQFLVIKALDPDWIWIRIRIRIRIGLHPDPSGSSGSGSVKNEYGSTTLIRIHVYARRENPKSCKRIWVLNQSCGSALISSVSSILGWIRIRIQYGSASKTAIQHFKTWT